MWREIKSRKNLGLGVSTFLLPKESLTKVSTINIRVSDNWDQYIFMSLSTTFCLRSTHTPYCFFFFRKKSQPSTLWQQTVQLHEELILPTQPILNVGTFLVQPSSWACTSVCLRLAKSRSHTIDKRQQQTRWANEYKFVFCCLQSPPESTKGGGCKTDLMRGACLVMAGDSGWVGERVPDFGQTRWFTLLYFQICIFPLLRMAEDPKR